MGRLNKQRELELSPIRMQNAIQKIQELNLEILLINDITIEFMFNNEKVKFFPYSGWHTGKSIKDGRGIQNLLKQLK